MLKLHAITSCKVVAIYNLYMFDFGPFIMSFNAPRVLSIVLKFSPSGNFNFVDHIPLSV